MEAIEEIDFCINCGVLDTLKHNFVHQKKTITMTKIRENDDKIFFIVDSGNFPINEIESDRCGFPCCNGKKIFHGNIIKNHDFTPMKTKERKCKVMIPMDTPCRKCGEIYETHDADYHTIKTHKFEYLVRFDNPSEFDTFELVKYIE